MNPRKKIELLKLQLNNEIQKNAKKYQRSIISKLYKLLKYFNGDVKSFTNNYLRQFKLTPKQKRYFTKLLEKTQLQITAVWDDYFDNTENFKPSDYEKLVAAYRVNFNDVEDAIKKQVEHEIKRSAKAGYNKKVIIKRLEKTGIGFSTAKTLVNTATAQFDNAYQIEIARQSGVIYYLYDGTISSNTRDFCKDHVGRVYTLQELAAMDNHQGLPVTTSLGGYNCQHYLTALVNYERKEVGEKYNPSHHKLAA